MHHSIRTVQVDVEIPVVLKVEVSWFDPDLRVGSVGVVSVFAAAEEARPDLFSRRRMAENQYLCASPGNAE